MKCQVWIFSWQLVISDTFSMTKTQLISQSRQSKQPNKQTLVDRWTLDCSRCSLFQRMPHFCISWRHTYCFWHPLPLNPCIKEIYNLPGEKQTNDHKIWGESKTTLKVLGNGRSKPQKSHSWLFPHPTCSHYLALVMSPLSIYIDWAHVPPQPPLSSAPGNILLSSGSPLVLLMQQPKWIFKMQI